MHPFSIDFITACNQDQDRNHGFDSRMTPSPTDSGMESDQSPSTSGSSNRDNAESLAEAIVSVDKQRSSPNEADEQDKPSHSYIALISMAILSSPEKRMLLSDIYQYIMDNFNFYNNQEKAWRNSIRHNLSLNECFMKNGRADNGKGNYWSIHPACEDDFARGDFRRRQARRRARRCIKGANYSNVSLPYRNNVGYVPMTASHIGYHPYTPSPSSSIYYPQAHAFTSLAQTTSPSTHQETLNSIYSQTTHNVAASNLFTQSAVYQRQHLQTSVPTSSALTAAAQRLLHEQTSAALAAQAFAPQHLNFQNW